MARTSYSQFRNGNNSLFTVSGVLRGYAHYTDKYMSDGIIQVAVSRLSVSTANYIELKNFPFKFNIVRASFNAYVKGKAGADLNIYKNTAANATQLIVGISMVASRGFYTDDALNFNNTNIDTTDSIRILASDIPQASAAAMKGMLTLRIRPI